MATAHDQLQSPLGVEANKLVGVHQQVEN